MINSEDLIQRVSRVIQFIERGWIIKVLKSIAGCEEACASCKTKLEGVSMREEIRGNMRSLEIMVLNIPFAKLQITFENGTFKVEEVPLAKFN